MESRVPLLSHRNASSVVFLTVLVLGFCLTLNSEEDSDPHRPLCTNYACKKARRFVKAHYCGKPVGNGPDDSCEIRAPKKPLNARVIVSFECSWPHGVRKCVQRSQPSPELQKSLVGELHKIGLPSKAPGHTYFTIWKPSNASWLLVEAYYDHITGETVTLCQVLAFVNQDRQLTLIKKVPFQKTSADKNTVTTWSLLDVADVDGSGKMSIVLQGDAYEDHGVEVDRIDRGKIQMIFSGFGYYL